ncbi:NAD-dependent epimerase/dehydratase family protein [candidate division KSB1 bacterium]
MGTVLIKENLPEIIPDIETLEDLLSTPTQGLVDDFKNLEGDIMVLGVGGKVGPTLAMMAKRAAPGKNVIGVARFSDPDVKRRLEEADIDCIKCDLLEQGEVKKLPEIPNIIYMAGKKFDTAGMEPFTWAMNVVVPTYVGERFKDSRIVAFSTLCVYPFADMNGPGWDETVKPTPLGEYANSCAGRERVFQYFSKKHNTPGRLVRLNYAIDLRYGVLQDIALKLLNKKEINISTGYANVIWQGDSTAQILRCLLHCEIPSSPINIGMPKLACIRDVAQKFAEHFNIEPQFVETEQDLIWHNNTSLAARLFGEPIVDLDTMIKWNAEWLKRDLPIYQKPTHYDQRQGVF